MRVRSSFAAGLALAGLVATAAVADPDHDAGFRTAVKPYAKGVPGSGWVTEPIISADDKVPETGTPGAQYRMVGIPDGLGAYRRGGTVKVLMTHEIAQKGPRDPSDRSEPRVGRPGQRGAFASEWILNREGEVISGRRAFDRVYQDDRFVGPAAQEDNATPAFSRWCSAFLAGPEVGLDRRIFFANEESGPSGSEEGKTTSFDPRGSQSVAIFDNEAHALSKLGRFPRENSVVMPHTGGWTVILSTEDGPAGTTDSQLYMYIGRKDRSSDSVLRRNGLDNGRLYVFASDDGRDNENAILQGDRVPGHFVEIPGADQMSDVQLEVASDAVGAFGYARVEDGMFDPSNARRFWFVTTGEQATESPDPHINELGRVYRLDLARHDPRQSVLTQAYNADQLTESQDGPMSPDNLDVTRRFVVVQEDGTGASRPDIGKRGRDGSIWMLPKRTPGDPATFTRVAELVGMTEGGRDGIRTGPGIWETSGIIDTRHEFGKDTFLFDVQAHPPTTPPPPPAGSEITREDGQLLLLRRAG
jgi:hypothetical protein